MEVVNNSALRITVPDHIASAITNSIEKSKILNTRGNLIDLLVYWGIEEMSQLNKLSLNPTYHLLWLEIIIGQGYINLLTTKKLHPNFYLLIINLFVLTKLVLVKPLVFYGQLIT